MNARRKMNIPYDTKEFSFMHRNSLDSLTPELNLKYLQAHDNCFSEFSLNEIHSSQELKTEEYYAQITNKALKHFSSLTEAEKHDFYYTFTHNGFKDALRTGRFHDGSKLIDMGNGKYSDRFGLVRDTHGPFWPIDYGPLHPTPQHARSLYKKSELLTTSNQGKLNTSALYKLNRN